MLTGYAAVFRPRFDAATGHDQGALGLGALRYVGQVGDTFLVCETTGALVVVDQHAAHERVTFHRLRAAFARRDVATQRLLFAQRVELPADLAPILEEHAPGLADLGLHVRPFGDHSFVIEEVPALLVHADAARLVFDLADELRATAHAGAFSERVDAVLSRLACHASKRAGDVLSREAAEALLKALDEVDFKANCPHGRPVIATKSFDEVAGWFERT